MTAKERNICMIAHRGYSGKYHENTELAFIKAGEHASGGAETDIRVTADGVYVCSHNETAVLENGEELYVSRSTFAELTAQPLKSKFEGQKVYLCTFRRYLEIMKQFDMVCFVELKGAFTPAQVKGVFGLVEEVYELKKCILQSFDKENLLEARRQFPDLPLMLTYGFNCGDYRFCLDEGISIDCDYNAITPGIISDFRSKNLEVAVWTVNDAEDFEKVKLMDVDYIESDFFGGND